ncbi:MAG: carboxypeptidase regulatory-like domain-containing protein [Elusimicrobia bacterium]|nr:carboxypeptidase regulatory-like domain-containing protein [Elusimicrobiota bacterium]
MVTVVILSVVGLGVAGAFSFVARGVQTFRAKTLAANLCQEQIESLKDKSYYQVIPTVSVLYESNFGTTVPYDDDFYAPETIAIGNGVFTRYTYVERVIVSGSSVTSVPYDSLDTGMKRLTVNTVWKTGSNWYKSSLTNLLANSEQASSGGFQGTVTDSGGVAVPDADVFTQGDAYYHDYTDSLGKYAFTVSPGSYTLVATAAGYFQGTSAVNSVTAGNVPTVNLTLTSMSSGTITGTVYLSDRPLISQVVSETNTVCGDGANHNVEYIELFNPTTYPINVSQTGPLSQNLKINYYDENAVSNKTDAQFNFTYVSTYIPPGRYYLISNATYFTVLGAARTADAYYGTLYSNYIRKDKAGALEIVRASDSAILDTVGWDDNNNTAPRYETASQALVASDGIGIANQLVRYSTPTAANDTYGKSFDSDDNSKDFNFTTLTYPPRSTSAAAQTSLAGRPAYGALITANDGLSTSTSAYRKVVGGIAYATFTLTGVATGQWTVQIASASSSLTITTVSVPSSGWVAVAPGSATTPAWPLANYAVANLTETATTGIVSGYVRTPTGTGISGITVLVEPSGSATTNSNGYYAAPVPAGSYSITANSGMTNPNYGSSSLAAVSVAVGQFVAGNDMVLSGAGRANGYVCNSNVANPYPAVSIAAFDSSSNLRAQTVSGTDGRFTLTNLSTGTYTVQAILDEAQSASTGSFTATIVSGSNVFVGTFTISGAYGVISGSVTVSGARITTGVLVVATTTTIAGSLPPTISTATASSVPYYMASSLSDGSYRVQVRTSTASANFNLYGWYTTYSGTTPNPVKVTVTGVNVTGGATTSRSLAW